MEEICHRAFDEQEKPLISYGGLPFAQTCRKHIDGEGFRASRVYIIASKTLSKTTTALQDLCQALDGKIAGVKTGMSPHTLMGECLELMRDVRRVNADCIVTLGGGSLTDAAKIISYALANDVETKSQLLALPHAMGADPGDTKPSRIPIIAIPTSISGGEYIPFAGVTDEEDQTKYQFTGRCPGPALIILSGELAKDTPVRTWLASGVRSIDHCIEALCTLRRPEKGWKEAEEASIKCLQGLIPSLLKTKAEPSNIEARHNAQLVIRYSLVPLKNRVFKGASHAIGHFLGPMNVSHGETSCILMTATHKYNAAANPAEQASVRRILWTIDASRDLFLARNLRQDTADLGDLLDVYVRELGLPRSLGEVGVMGREKLERLAANTLKDPYARTNPIPLIAPEQVLRILEMCK